MEQKIIILPDQSINLFEKQKKKKYFVKKNISVGCK